MKRKILSLETTVSARRVSMSPVLHGPLDRRDPNLNAVIRDPVHRVDRRYLQVDVFLIQQQARHDQVAMRNFEPIRGKDLLLRGIRRGYPRVNQAAAVSWDGAARRI